MVRAPPSRGGIHGDRRRSGSHGVLFSPAIAASAFLTGAIALALGLAHASMGTGTEIAVALDGPFLILCFAALDAVIFPIISLFFMSWTNRRRLVWLGMIAAMAIGVVCSVCDVPVDPLLPKLLFRFGRFGLCLLLFSRFYFLSASLAP